MSASQAKAQLDQEAGEPSTRFIDGSDVKAAIDIIYADTAASIDAAVDAAIAALPPAQQLPTGGDAGKALLKTSGSDFHVQWGDPRTMYGDHVAHWNGSAWRYRGTTLSARPANVAAFGDGGRVIWNSSLHSAVTEPPVWAIAGDVWIPHGEVAP